MAKTNKNGVTLTELLVSSILIGVIMIGVASFSVSIQQLHSATNRATLLSMRTMTAMNLLTKSAYLAVGDNVDPGIQPFSPAPTNNVCFRSGTNDPSSYGNSWDCYFSDASNNLWVCGPDAVPPANAFGVCDQPAGSAYAIVQLDPLSGTGNNFFQITVDGDNRLETVQFNLTTIFDISKLKHPVSNPTYTVTTEISPPAHSR